MRICHVTSVHRPLDERIYYKECLSLKQRGFDVTILASGDSFESEGIEIRGYGNRNDYSRLQRIIRLPGVIFKHAMEVGADIYHIHDPELLPLAKKLSRKGKKVIFDSHEDYVRTFLAKEWIPNFLRRPISLCYMLYECSVCKKLSGFIACYHWTKDRVGRVCANTELVFNYPSVSLLSTMVRSTDRDCVTVVYAGGISRQWMHHNVLSAVASTGCVRYCLAGEIDDQYGEQLRNLEEWKFVDYLGHVNHSKVNEVVYSRGFAGIAILDYIPQCDGKIGNLSNTKLFEYMLYGLPVICTDFRLWKEIIDEYKCGVCVEPNNPEAIAEAIMYLKNNPDIASEMGRNGMKAIKEKYNWENTSQGMFRVYDRIIAEMDG